MLGRGVLSRLHCLTESDDLTLTLYADVDQNRQSNRNRGFEVQVDALLKGLRAHHGDDAGLAAAAARARELIAGLEAQGATVLVVVHPASGLEEVHQLRVALAASCHWRRGAFLRPVVEAMDEHERYGVVLTDQQRARLFTLYLGELEEHTDLLSPTGQRTAATGSDHWRSQKRFQRHHEQEVTTHAKRVVDALHDLSLRAPFDRLIVAGPIHAASQVARLLPRRLHGKLAETVALPVTASHREVLERLLEVQQRMERRHEEELVEGVAAELHDGGKAVAGLAAVVEAVNHGRVWTLLYVKGLAAAGAQCRGCGGFTAALGGFCDTCRGRLEEVPFLLDRIGQTVLDGGGRVDVVDGVAAERLDGVGSIAALLRY